MSNDVETAALTLAEKRSKILIATRDALQAGRLSIIDKSGIILEMERMGKDLEMSAEEIQAVIFEFFP